MDFVITYSNKKSVSELPIEIVERKGKGHPDTICDSSAEEASIALSNYYLKKYNRILHHNLDKAVLVGGQAEVNFGGGKVVKPIEIIIVGRAVTSVNNDEVPVNELIQSAVKSWIKNEMRFLNPETDLIVQTKVRGGSVDLVKNFERGITVPLANDTSIGTGFAPLSIVENLTLKIEEHLNSKKIKEEYPVIGEDIKVMSVRKNNELKVTIACAFISKYVSNLLEYSKYKDIVKKEAEYIIDSFHKFNKYNVTVNAADEYRSGIYYLTVTGTSAEHGDDGQVGRGNRCNGLITPYRAMTLEATAGKNPISHTGKLYSVAAQKICNRLVNEFDDIKEAYCYMVSKIGSAIVEPKIVNVDIIPYKKGPDESEIESIVKEEIENIPNYWKEILEKKIKLFY